jgi:hypothetical protein
VEKLGIVHGKGIVRRAQFHETTHVPKKMLTRGIVQPTQIERVGLLLVVAASALQIEVHRVGELVAGEDHRHAHGREQTDESELGSVLPIGNVKASKEIEEAIVARAVGVGIGNVVRAEVVDDLGAVDKA